MEAKPRKKSEVFDVIVTAVGAVFSVGTMLYAVWHFGLREAWPELVLNVFYIACLVMMWMYYFKHRINSIQFNYWCSVCVGATVLLRDILFPPPLAFYALHLLCLVFSVLLLLMLTYLCARTEWENYSKRSLWMICIVDMIIAALYTYALYLEPIDEYTNYMLTEIWIRPTITYGLVACFVSEAQKKNEGSLDRLNDE